MLSEKGGSITGFNTNYSPLLNVNKSYTYSFSSACLAIKVHEAGASHLTLGQSSRLPEVFQRPGPTPRIAQVSLHSRINLSPFTKDFRGEERWWVQLIFVGFAVAKLYLCLAKKKDWQLSVRGGVCLTCICVWQKRLTAICWGRSLAAMYVCLTKEIDRYLLGVESGYHSGVTALLWGVLQARGKNRLGRLWSCPTLLVSRWQ